MICKILCAQASFDSVCGVSHKRCAATNALSSSVVYVRPVRQYSHFRVTEYLYIISAGEIFILTEPSHRCNRTVTETYD